MTETQGRFLVTEAGEDDMVLRDVQTGQVHTFEENPGLTVDMAVEATIETVPPMDVVWTVVEIHETWDIEIVVSEERPTKTSRELAEEGEVADLQVSERAGTGEIHVITVPEKLTESAFEDVLEDQQTLRMAARLGIERVEVRSEPGIVTVRYLP